MIAYFKLTLYKSKKYDHDPHVKARTKTWHPRQKETKRYREKIISVVVFSFTR